MRDLKVISPMTPLYSREAVEVALIAVEVEPSGVILRLAGLPTEETAALERNYVKQLDAWVESGRKGEPPDQPAESLFDVELSLSDDVGTSYTLRTIGVGGSGRMFRAEWFFQPGPSSSASRLTVAAAGASVDVDL